MARGAVTRPIGGGKSARATGDHLLKPDVYLSVQAGGTEIVKRYVAGDVSSAGRANGHH